MPRGLYGVFMPCQCVDYMLHQQQLLREEIVEYLKKRKGGPDDNGDQGDDGMGG